MQVRQVQIRFDADTQRPYQVPVTLNSDAPRCRVVGMPPGSEEWYHALPHAQLLGIVIAKKDNPYGYELGWPCLWWDEEKQCCKHLDLRPLECRDDNKAAASHPVS